MSREIERAAREIVKSKRALHHTEQDIQKLLTSDPLPDRRMERLKRIRARQRQMRADAEGAAREVWGEGAYD